MVAPEPLSNSNWHCLATSAGGDNSTKAGPLGCGSLAGATLRVHLVGYDAADLEALARSFWGGR